MDVVFDSRKAPDERERGAWRLVKPVSFVGFMGAGKTSAARKLARRAGVASIDMDMFIERRYDMKIREIFSNLGEEGFRLIETDVLRELATGDPLVVSCGGGVVLSEENRRIMRENGHVVYLKVTADEAASRITNLKARPLFGDLDQVRHIISERIPLYEEVADSTIDTAGHSSGYVAREAIGLLKRQGILVC